MARHFSARPGAGHSRRSRAPICFCGSPRAPHSQCPIPGAYAQVGQPGAIQIGFEYSSGGFPSYAVPMLKCSTSLWSADLANLVSEIRRVEPYSERFHLDVADGHYVPNLLFFPDLVRALRPHTNLPFEVHLMVTDPLAWVEPFVEAGADGIIFCYDSVPDPGAVLRRIKA